MKTTLWGKVGQLSSSCLRWPSWGRFCGNETFSPRCLLIKIPICNVHNFEQSGGDSPVYSIVCCLATDKLKKEASLVRQNCQAWERQIWILMTIRCPTFPLLSHLISVGGSSRQIEQRRMLLSATRPPCPRLNLLPTRLPSAGWPQLIGLLARR